MKIKVSEIASINSISFKNKNKFVSLQYLETSGVTKGFIEKTTTLVPTIDKIPSRAQRGVQKGTIAISTVRPEKEHYVYIEYPAPNLILSSGFVTIDVFSEKVDSKYLYYKLTSPMVTKYLDTIANTAVSSYPSFKPEILANYELEIAEDITTQRKIASLLSALDAKIANNASIAAELEAAARLLYDYWFVQFDFPDENGKPYKSSGGKMTWNQTLKREIPEGWTVTALEGMYVIARGLSYTSADIKSGKGIPMLNLACIDTQRNYRDGELKYHNGKVPQSSMLKAGDLLIACTDLTRNADIVGSPFLVPDDENEYTFSMDLAKISSTTAKLDDMYLYMSLRTDYYHKYIKKWASGTNVLHLNLQGIDWYTMWLPPMKLQQKYSFIVKNIHKRTSQILNENRQLATLRDFLLPMLMNGQVKISQ